MTHTALTAGTPYFEDDLRSAPIHIIDDEPVNLQLLERILSSNGYTNITCIQSPFEAVELFRKNRPSLVLLDINMPGMNGFGVLEKLKADFPASLPPIVFITAQDCQRFRAKAYEEGVLDYISKPFNRVELLSRVKNLLSLHTAYQKLESRNQSLEEMVEQRTDKLWETQLEVVQKLGRAAEYRDNETGAHILRMSHTSSLLAKSMGCRDDFAKLILYASPMHDIGKIAIPDNILLKPGKLTPSEWETMKAHTTIGANILQGSQSELMKLASEISLHHHEKWDGSGYPDGLEKEAIPLSCRIIAIADVFDALVSDRPYKQAWHVKKAQEFINDNSGLHFDPDITSVFNNVFSEILTIKERYKDTVPESETVRLPVHDKNHAGELMAGRA